MRHESRTTRITLSVNCAFTRSMSSCVAPCGSVIVPIPETTMRTTMMLIALG
jgi:hypothetical protein